MVGICMQWIVFWPLLDIFFSRENAIADFWTTRPPSNKGYSKKFIFYSQKITWWNFDPWFSPQELYWFYKMQWYDVYFHIDHFIKNNITQNFKNAFSSIPRASRVWTLINKEPWIVHSPLRGWTTWGLGMKVRSGSRSQLRIKRYQNWSFLSHIDTLMVEEIVFHNKSYFIF